MPTYDELDNEAAWRDEIAAPALARLADGLRREWPGAQIGIRGDNRHLAGYHRSRRWIRESRFCTNDTYSVSRTAGDRSGGDPNWSCAVDLGLTQSELHAVCRRLDEAVRAGRLEKITEWYGTFGDDLRVDGWDNIANRLASADSSHLTHLHMSFDRGRANEDHTDLLAILTGEDMDTVLDHNTAWRLQEMLAGKETITVPPDKTIGATGFSEPNQPQIQLNRLEVKVAELEVPAAAPVDPQALVAALKPTLDAMEARLNARIDASVAENRDAVADLGEGGAAKVRAES